MKRAALIFVLALLAAGRARALDMQGGPLTPADYAILSGTYTNVGEFKVLTATMTVFVGQGGLYIYATTVTVLGVLNADGSGFRGGGGGANTGTGLPGGLGLGPGPGGGGAAKRGGGGGGYGNAGGYGDIQNMGGGAGGTEYNSTTTISVPLSAADISMGSGGGGGGGGNAGTDSGVGGAGGGLIYLEANYVTVSGTITANGQAGGPGWDTVNTVNCSTSPGGGGGGAGGGILIKAIKDLSLSNAVLAANGGIGGATSCPLYLPPLFAGGGGAGGRIKLVYSTAAFTTVTISTGAGRGGEKGIGVGSYAMVGSSGTVSYGILPSSPTGLDIMNGNVFTSSITYNWDPKTSGWGGPVSLLPGPTYYQFRLYESTTAAPLSDFYWRVTVSSNITTRSEPGLIPNTIYHRFITAYTDYGDSMPSGTVSTHTFAAAPQAAADSAFPSAAADSITFAWASGTAASGFNPAYTTYEISRATASDFNAPVSTGFVTALSSAPAGLSANTTYYFRVRALGLNGSYTAFTQPLSSVTLAFAPSEPTFSGVHIDSLSFTWNAAANPEGTLFEAQLSANNFLTISSAVLTQATTAYFTALNPGTTYYAQVRAVNHSNIRSTFTAVILTAPGNFTNLADPAKPEPPQPTAKFSYNGSAIFTWYPPSGGVPLFSYFLEIGSTPGGNDFLFGFETPSSILSYSTNTLVSGKTYYARVRAKSSAGRPGDWSDPGPGVAVWISQTEAPVTKPYNWPNPFDPAVAPTNIGFNLVSPAQVTLKIFTLQGALVYETNANEANGGNKIWQWNGRNGRGTMVEPGGYVGLIIKHYAGGTDSQKFKMAVLY